MRIGEIQKLPVVREMPQGLYLGDDQDSVLLPRGQCPRDAAPGDVLEVFVYTDSEDRPVATLRQPKATAGQFAFLRVVAINGVGAFLDWGLDKDLFCPAQEQATRMREGQSYLVRVYLDEASQRLVCTSKLAKFVRPEAEDMRQGQPVTGIVWEVLPQMTTLILDNRVRGTLFPDEIVEPLRVGEVRTVYIKRIRPDDLKVAVSLRPQGFHGVLNERDRLLAELRDNGGFLPVSDKSPPEVIYKRFGLSKGAFKKLIGALYRDGIIAIDDNSIRLTK